MRNSQPASLPHFLLTATENRTVSTTYTKMLPSLPTVSQKGASPRGDVVPSILGVPGMPQNPLLAQNQPARERALSQVNVAAQGLNVLYSQLKLQWDRLKGSVETLLNDLGFVLPRYFEVTGQREKASSIPSVEDVIKSFQLYGNTLNLVGRPLQQFVTLLNSSKSILPHVKQIKDVEIQFNFKKPLTDSLKHIEDFAEGKKAHDKTHPEVLNLTKDLKSVRTIYLPLISTLPFLFDNIKMLQENLQIELSSMGRRNVQGDDLLSVPIMLQAGAAIPVPVPNNLIEIDAQVMSMYRQHIIALEQNYRLLLQENQHLTTTMLMDKFQIPHNLNSYADRGLLVDDVGHGTALEKMLRIFDQKISMCILKDVTRINFTTSIFSAGIFDSKGGNLTIADAGVNLFIPPGAIPPRTNKEIYIYLDQNTHLKLEKKNETRISPIVHCGPPGTSFKVPFVLSFPHCAEDEEQWTFSGMIKNSSDPGDHWQNISDDCDGICLVQGGHCFIMVDHFTKFALKGATRGQEVSKLIHFCTFGKSYDRSNSYCFNVRAWNPHDKAVVLEEQRKLHEACLDSIKTLSVQNTGKDVKVYLKNLKEGWISEYEKEMKISYEELWSEPEDGSTPPSCRFRLKTKDSQQSDSVYCRVKSKQDGRKKEIALEVRPDTSTTQQNMDTMAMESIHPIGIEVDLLACRRIYGPMDSYDLPEDVCYKLCIELDSKEANLRDWRGLAEQLHLDSRVIENIDRTMKCPTSCLLNILSIISAPGEFCKNLGEKLKAAKLELAYAKIKPYIKSQ
ncbi:uncharacterized protein LOC117125560 [Anneissia japonica]|uniref:uncharacterized protein LOC117125560 n=1 Tax=Anneissia japonica TaxID=1529436 RepID=UPI001425952D|nr:uncharacterized protein LOC117125560 [Anneissia japonica]